jgi:3-methyladenine DNA glycosylase AlkD
MRTIDPLASNVPASTALKLHRRLLASIKAHQRHRFHSQANDSYLSSGHHYWDVAIPTLRMIAKEWLKQNKGIDDTEFRMVLDALYSGNSYEEKVLASILLAYAHARRVAIGPKQLNAWLGCLVGWAEIDSLCASTFTADEMLADWRAWQRLIRGLAQNKNINKRRAALVFLTAATRRSDDERLAFLAFEMVDALKSHREIIITKAVSWLLRSMVEHHARAVADYVRENRRLLPAIAVRETSRKIATGRK